MKKILRLIHSNRISSERGQSLVEIAIFLPIFILLIAGIAEMGWYLNRYLNMLDASREAARLAADRDPVGNGTNGTTPAGPNPVYNPQYNQNSPLFNPDAPINCDTTTDTYAVIACYAEESLIGAGVPFSPTNGYDDIVISAFTIKNSVVHNGWRYPDYFEGTSDLGWSYTGQQERSLFPNSEVDTRVDSSVSQGLIILEIFYRHRQVLALPFFTIFVPADIDIHVYTIMPNPTAGTVQ